MLIIQLTCPVIERLQNWRSYFPANDMFNIEGYVWRSSGKVY